MFNNCLEAQNEFEKCWSNREYTQIALDVDVNKAITFYSTNKPLLFTRVMLWDMEKKKAWNPGNYIPYVVREGSGESWGKKACPMTGGEIFVRASHQKQWLNPKIYEEVYEEVYVNEKEQLVTFIGTKKLPGRPNELKLNNQFFMSNTV